MPVNAAPVDPAPVDPAALAETLKPFGASRTLPAQAYTDPEVLAWERRHFFAGGWGAETMSLDGRSRGAFIDGADRRTVSYAGLFPNLLVSPHPDYVLTHRLEPLAPDRTRVECCWYVPEGVTDVSYAVDFWDVTNREDWAACESVQRGMASPHYRPGPLAPSEDAVYQWMTLVARAYRDPAAAFRTEITRAAR
jgi:phenylpropionate dioxygenase-like ring-hydroxylating dioxygenase large terminal subunit